MSSRQQLTYDTLPDSWWHLTTMKDIEIPLMTRRLRWHWGYVHLLFLRTSLNRSYLICQLSYISGRYFALICRIVS